MNGSRRIPCPVRGCQRTRQPLHVMCRQHWLKVPKGMRQTIWRLFHEQRGSDSHRMAIDAAIGEVEQQESAAVTDAGDQRQGTGP